MTGTAVKTLRIPEKLNEEIQQDVAQSGFPSENEYMTKAIEHFLTCKKADVIQGMKLIVFKYKGTCLKCGHEIPVGSYGFWAKGTGAICLDCHVMRYGDKLLVKRYMKVKEYDTLLKALEVQCDEKAEQFRGFNFYEIMEKIHQNSNTLHSLIMEYLKAGFDKPEAEKTVLDEIQRLIEDQRHVLADAEQFMKVPLKKKKKEIPNY
jgi:mRNA-degrading endonuclease HigB of HigAB toxin-antitoxin module